MASNPRYVSTRNVPNPQFADSLDNNVSNLGRPFLFTVTEPNSNLPLYDVTLALHVNPNSVEERMIKTKSVSMTYGGYVEFMWPDEFDTISCSGSTGAFITPSKGLSSHRSDSNEPYARSKSQAYERYQDFLDLFHNNGIIYDSKGVPAIRGRVMMIYERGVFLGHFTSFSVTEEEEKPFQFDLSWEFKVERSVYKFPQTRLAL